VSAGGAKTVASWDRGQRSPRLLAGPFLVARIRCMYASPFLVLSLFVAPGVQPADDDARSLLARIVLARGGKNLSEVQAYHLKLRSFLTPEGKKIFVDGTLSLRGFDRCRVESRIGQREFVSVLDGDRGWHREQGKTREMNAQEL